MRGSAPWKLFPCRDFSPPSQSTRSVSTGMVAKSSGRSLS